MKTMIRAIGLLDRQVEVYEAMLRQKVEAKIQASIREYKALLLAENDRTPGPPGEADGCPFGASLYL